MYSRKDVFVLMLFNYGKSSDGSVFGRKRYFVFFQHKHLTLRFWFLLFLVIFWSVFGWIDVVSLPSCFLEHGTNGLKSPWELYPHFGIHEVSCVHGVLGTGSKSDCFTDGGRLFQKFGNFFRFFSRKTRLYWPAQLAVLVVWVNRVKRFGQESSAWPQTAPF